MTKERVNYLDNMKWITVVLVVIYHIIYIFNCSGVIKNINVDGIPFMDSFLVFVNPWFMCLLFVVSGITMRHALSKRTNKEFIKDRAKRILVPSIAGMFIYGWIAGVITSQYTDIFAGNGAMIPAPIKYLILCMIGVGPLWFCRLLFVASLVLLLIIKLDKNNRIEKLCEKINLPILLLLVIPVWGSSFILNLPLIKVYRFGIYFFMMFLGYYVFYKQNIIEKLEKISIPLVVVAFLTGIAYVFKYYGVNYAEYAVLDDLFTNVYLWISILAIFGISSKYLNFKNKFTEYMTKNNFNIYILHFTVVLCLGYAVVNYLSLPFMLNYLVILIGTIIILPLLIEVVKRVPILKFLVLGICKKKEVK